MHHSLITYANFQTEWSRKRDTIICNILFWFVLHTACVYIRVREYVHMCVYVYMCMYIITKRLVKNFITNNIRISKWTKEVNNRKIQYLWYVFIDIIS